MFLSMSTESHHVWTLVGFESRHTILQWHHRYDNTWDPIVRRLQDYTFPDKTLFLHWDWLPPEIQEYVMLLAASQNYIDLKVKV